MTSANKSLEKESFLLVENVIKQLVHMSAVHLSRYVALGKFREQEATLCLEQLLRIFCALQTSCMLPILMNAHWHMNQLLIDNMQCSKIIIIIVIIIIIIIIIIISTLTHSCPLCHVAGRAALCCFHNMGVLWDRVVSPVPNPSTWRTSGSCLIRPLPFDLSSLGGPTRRWSSCWQSFRGLWGTQARWPQQDGNPLGE